MIRRLFLVLGLLFAFTATAQGYYPGVRNLLSMSDDRKLPPDLRYFDTWARKITNYFFYKNLQTSTGTKNEGSFYGLSLIVKRQNSFKIGNTGFEFTFNKNKVDFTEPIPLTYSDVFKIRAFAHFDAEKYSPDDFAYKYELGLYIYNIREEEIIRNCLNNYVNPNEGNNYSKLTQLLADLRDKANVEIKVDEKSKELTKAIAVAFYQKTGKFPAETLYKMYVSNPDKSKEAVNFNKFFSQLGIPNASETIDGVVSYEADVQLPNKNITVSIPKEVLVNLSNAKLSNAVTGLEVTPSQIELKAINTSNEKCVEITLWLKTKDLMKFKVVNEVKLNKTSKSNQHQSEGLEKLVFKLYEKQLQAELFFTENKRARSLIIYKEDYQLNE